MEVASGGVRELVSSLSFTTDNGEFMEFSKHVQLHSMKAIFYSLFKAFIIHVRKLYVGP
jgi:hypothetical protein